ncbi:transmembrane protein 128 isoform X2 [Latimeria chalumnae]
MAILMGDEELQALRQRFKQKADVYLQNSTLSFDRESEIDLQDKKEKKPLPRFNIHSGFWILTSIAVTYYVEFFTVVKETVHGESWWFLFGSFLLIISLAVAFYCIIYLEWYCGVSDYDNKYPALVPLATATFVSAAICFNISLWHVWSFFTPFILLTQFMGLVMLVSLLG